MGRPHASVYGEPRVVAGAAVGLAYALLVSFTHPFTWAADAVTAVALVVVAGVTVRASPPRRRRRGHEPAGTHAHLREPPTRRALVWMAPLLAITGWELYCFVSLPRVEHPTLSSLIDLLDSTRPGKFAAVVLWLALGWFLVSR